jgi:plasmid stability protein
MATILIKNLPDSVYASLKILAVRHNRSVTKEVITLIADGVASARRSPIVTPGSEAKAAGEVSNAPQYAVAEPSAPYVVTAAESDGRAALRAALVLQPDGSYVNVLGIDDKEFFANLDNVRTEAPAPNVTGLFDEQD